MERSVFFVLILVGVSSALDPGLITESVPAVSGVLLLTGPKGQYQFNFSEASEACHHRNLSIATRSQLQSALDTGLEACRFGWISERVAAVPRLSPVLTCGSGKTGVVTWNAPQGQRFGAWCFSRSDSNGAGTTTLDQITTVAPKTTAPPPGTTAAVMTTQTPATATTSADPETAPATPTATSAPWTRVTREPRIQPSGSSSAPFPKSSEKVLTIASSSAPGSTPAVQDYSSKPAVSSASVKPPRPRALSTALIVLCVIVLVLSAGGAVFHYKLSERWDWPRSAQKADVTDTWKQTCSELELQEEGEEGGRFSSETTLYVNHDATAD